MVINVGQAVGPLSPEILDPRFLSDPLGEQVTLTSESIQHTRLGARNWEIVWREVGDIVGVSENNFAEAVPLLFRLASLKVEATGAAGVATVLEQPEPFRGRSVCRVTSGDKVDPFTYAS